MGRERREVADGRDGELLWGEGGGEKEVFSILILSKIACRNFHLLVVK
jgi:hypothetical protein